VLRQGVQGISDLITVPGLINLDFADVRAIMKDAGSALMGIGRGSGASRAADAARMAISSPLLEINIAGAQGVLFNITGGPGLGLFEIDEAAEIIKETADAEANIIFGTVIDERMGDDVAITVIATGFDSSRRREVFRPTAHAAEEMPAALRAGQPSRDFLRELEQQRAAAAAVPIVTESHAVPVMQAAAPTPAPAQQQSAQPPSQAPASPYPPGTSGIDRADATRRTPEVEDLDIPAFLRRNR